MDAGAAAGDRCHRSRPGHVPLYSSGVFTARCGAALDHAVLITGYGEHDGVDYWRIKNSWGTSWGMDGYMLLERGEPEDKTGKCGILLATPYPSLAQQEWV